MRTARERVLSAALELFAEHGVSGTSLQMIADRMGVTKAAVYHQFPTKEEIVLAVIDPVLLSLTPIAASAARRRTPAARRRYVLDAVVDLVVEHRRLSAVLSFDPVVSRLVRQHPSMTVISELVELLTGPDPSPATRVDVAMVAGGLVMAGAESSLSDLPDETLKTHLLKTSLRTLRLNRS
ncbi:AcrR family transcriptional regulator [Actinoplanes lutulentus]|uniref:TetR family transcriptional regulator n=1 Tax=Actinoplanes lutulentus TaxID=1287878 RepID=A0A327ZJK8_9ACTN|nr:TetR/AcrR family transcriptional regulator [Actinoplanes lutulentus]MBB2941356.1 AcrR family transcriptional regulator [Actinoplanes lutulentus]RAK36848.1 TetR family transcriptional regulator [Actinoplanes lutulentus]